MTYYISTPNAVEARRRMMRRLINDTFESERALTVPMNVVSNDDEYIISAMLPGLTADQVNIQFNNGTVTIDGNYEEIEQEGFESHLSELPVGRFSRSLEFNNPVAGDKITAEMKNGILTIHIPKAEEAKPKTIKIISKE